MLLLTLGQASAQADVTAVRGSAFGYQCVVTVFGQSCSPASGTPSVSLASNASNSPQSATTMSGNASAGPATLFSSGQISVSTQGTLGATGSVTSSSTIQNVNASGNEPFTATTLAGSCTASQAGGATGSTTITGGTLQTDSGDDDPTNSIPDHPPVDVALPTNPSPNTEYTGHVHIGNTTDNFRYVFNEQVQNADGSITVNAAHEYLLGPTAVGDLIVGQSICGVTASDTTPPQTTIDSGPSGTISTNSASFAFSSSEPNSTFECKLDGPGAATGTFGSCTSPKNYSSLADGSYTFSVRATDAAGNTDQTAATRTFTVNTTPAELADLSVDLADSPDPVRARGELTYTVTVTNNGPGTATGVTVFTTKPRGTRFLAASGADCTVVRGKEAGIRCDLGSIASGDSKQFTIVIRAPGRRKPFTTRSSVSSSTSDPVSGNNTDTETTTVVKTRSRSRRGRV